MTAVTQKGQTTILADIRAYLGLTPGDQVEFVVVNRSVVLRKATGSKAYDYGHHLFAKWSLGKEDSRSRDARKAMVAEAMHDKYA